MEENLKNLLKELKGKEDTRQNSINEINMELGRIGWRQESEEERFAGKREKDENGEMKWLKQGGIYDDIKAGIYNNKTEGQMQKIIDEELEKIKQKYDAERLDVNKKLEEIQKQNEEEKANDYKTINAAIKEYHLDMVLETNKANKELTAIETERNEKLAEFDKLIKEKEAERTHMIMQNRNFMDIEASENLGAINALGQEIEKLKEEREGVNSEYASKLKLQSDRVEYCNQQKERAAQFLGTIILSEKSVDEIHEILFGEEKQQENKQENEQPLENSESIENTQETQNDQEIQEEQGEQNVDTETTPSGQENAQPQSTNQGTNSPKPVNEPINNPVQNIENTENTENKKFSYKFSIKGIEYDGKKIDINKLLIWHEEYQEDIESAIKSAMGDEKNIEEFLQGADKLIYLSIISKNLEQANDGKMQLSAQAKERLEEYYKVWENPRSEEESNMDIEYNLIGTSAIARFFRGSFLTKQDVDNIKENAFETRNRKNVSIDRLTNIEFKIKEFFQKIKEDRETKKLEAAEESRENNGNEENNSTRTFRDWIKSIARTRSEEPEKTETEQPEQQQENEPITPNQSDDAR